MLCGICQVRNVRPDSFMTGFTVKGIVYLYPKYNLIFCFGRPSIVNILFYQKRNYTALTYVIHKLLLQYAK